MKKLKSFRLNESLLESAKKKGIDLTRIIEAAIASVLKENKCPYCKGEIKPKRR
jgi:post-segregation antitoxin (ccd killing protein)